MENTLNLPSLDEVTETLSNALNILDGDGELDVRLQVYEDGAWAIRTGAPDYDQDHRGFWGAATINTEDDGDALRHIAADLISQVEDSFAQSR